MDRDSFNNLDREYQNDLNAAKQKINEKWQSHYAGKKYTGTPEMQAKAKANDNEQMKQRINAEIGGMQQRINNAHYGDKNRDDVLKELERQEEIKRRTEQARQEFQKRANDNNRGR